MRNGEDVEGRGRGRERCVLGLFSSLKGKKIVLGGRDDATEACIWMGVGGSESRPNTCMTTPTDGGVKGEQNMVQMVLSKAKA